MGFGSSYCHGDPSGARRRRQCGCCRRRTDSRKPVRGSWRWRCRRHPCSCSPSVAFRWRWAAASSGGWAMGVALGGVELFLVAWLWRHRCSQGFSVSWPSPVARQNETCRFRMLGCGSWEVNESSGRRAGCAAGWPVRSTARAKTWGDNPRQSMAGPRWCRAKSVERATSCGQGHETCATVFGESPL